MKAWLWLSVGASLCLQSIVAQTVTDDFSASTNWTAPTASGFGQLSFGNGRLNYTVSGNAASNVCITSLIGYIGPYGADWSCQVDMHFAYFAATDPAFANIGLGISKTGGDLSSIVFGIFNRGYYIGIGGYVPGDETQISSTLTDVAFELDYKSGAQTVTVSYFDTSWHAIRTYSLASWNLTDSDTFTILLEGNSGTDATPPPFGPEIIAGQAYWDNFSATGLVAIPEVSTQTALLGLIAFAYVIFNRQKRASARVRSI